MKDEIGSRVQSKSQSVPQISTHIINKKDEPSSKTKTTHKKAKPLLRKFDSKNSDISPEKDESKTTYDLISSSLKCLSKLDKNKEQHSEDFIPKSYGKFQSHIPFTRKGDGRETQKMNEKELSTSKNDQSNEIAQVYNHPDLESSKTSAAHSQPLISSESRITPSFTSIFPLHPVLSQSSLNADCSCKGGYSASVSSLRSTSTSASVSDPISPPLLKEEEHIGNVSCRNFSSFEVEGEIASIMGGAGPPHIGFQDPDMVVQDGRKVPINDGLNFNDSSWSYSQPDPDRLYLTQPGNSAEQSRLDEDQANMNEVPSDFYNNFSSVVPNVHDSNKSTNCKVIRCSDDAGSSSFQPTCDRPKGMLGKEQRRSFSQADASMNNVGGGLYVDGGQQEEDNVRPAVPEQPWSSTCSESAYETIRSKDRRLDEALASSFEFYCTASKDARAVGYVSSTEEVGFESLV